MPKDHPQRPLLAIVNEDELYSYTGRPSIPPEKLLQVLYTFRSGG